MSDETVRIGKSDLQEFASTIFTTAGVRRDWAEQWAKTLVWADLRGTDSHGVIRIPRYLDLLAKKAIKLDANMRVTKRSGAIAVLEADRAPGPVAMMRAVEEAIGRAREVHVGWCAARNITHGGAIGYYALQVAEAGLAGVVLVASSPLMAYHGTRVAGVSTNPLAIAVPAKRHRPFLLDMSTSTVANGKLMGARDRGASIPLGWAIDAEGHDTTNPAKAKTLLPLGGPKGSGLSFMIEALSSLAVGNPLVTRALASGSGLESPVLNGVVIAVDLNALGDFDQFTSEVEHLGEAIAALPRAEGVDRVYLPGERGDSVLAEREKTGIPIAKGTWSRIVKAASALGVASPV